MSSWTVAYIFTDYTWLNVTVLNEEGDYSQLQAQSFRDCNIAGETAKHVPNKLAQFLLIAFV